MWDWKPPNPRLPRRVRYLAQSLTFASVQPDCEERLAPPKRDDHQPNSSSPIVYQTDSIPCTPSISRASDREATKPYGRKGASPHDPIPSLEIQPPKVSMVKRYLHRVATRAVCRSRSGIRFAKCPRRSSNEGHMRSTTVPCWRSRHFHTTDLIASREQFQSLFVLARHKCRLLFLLVG